MYKWQTDGSISWRDGYYNSHPDLPLSVSTTEWDDLYTAFSGSWSLFGIIKGILDLIAAIPTGRYWLNPVDNQSLSEPLAVAVGDRYLIPGTATGGANWLVDGPAGGPVQDCIAECTGLLPTTWEYWGDPAVWGGAQDHDLDDGASVWEMYNDIYWVYDATGAAWIQCGGSTLEKTVDVGGTGVYNVNSTTDRGTTFIVIPAGGTRTLVLPALADGLLYRFIKESATGGDHVDISVLDGESECIYLAQRQFVLDVGGTPIYETQPYRKIRLVSEFDSVTILGTKHGWAIIDGSCTLTDVSPRHSGTAQGASSNTHITLEATASSQDEEYVGRLIFITACTGVPGAVGQIRRITAYNGTTQEATISPAWTATPDNTATYDMVRYDSLPLGMGEVGSIYSNRDMDDYDLTGAAFSKSGFPTISRYAGLNTSDAWGALLLGKYQHAYGGAKFATAFGKHGRVRWDNQMLFGDLPVQSIGGGVLTPGLCQVSRLIFGEYVATGDHNLLLGTGDGETAFVTEVGKAYYVTYSVIASLWNPVDQAYMVSWSGSFVAYRARNAPYTLSILAGSDNQVETGNLNIVHGTPNKDLTLQVAVDTDNIRFVASNAFPNNNAQFVGFADVIELEYYTEVW